MKKERKIKLIDILKKLNFSKKTPAQEKLQIKKNEAIIDMSLKKLSKYVGRKLTEAVSYTHLTLPTNREV